MAKLKKLHQMQELTVDNEILPSSYAKETACNLLESYGLHFRHNDIAKELHYQNSVYKKLLQLPVFTIYNQNLVNRMIENHTYLIETLTTIKLAVEDIQDKDRKGKSPLTEHKQEVLDKLSNNVDITAEEAINLAEKHDNLKDETYKDLYDQLYHWRKLCYDTTMVVCEKLIDAGLNLPEEFFSILRKYLERPGSLKLSAEEKKEMNLDQNLTPAEMAVVCALREVQHGKS